MVAKNETFTRVYGRISVGSVLPHIGSGKRLKFGTARVGVSSLRLIVFKRDNCTCMKCGRVGNIFVIERHHKQDEYHLNLYYETTKGDLILMTKDHIIPVSVGGRNLLHNLQTMCCVCNTKKGHSCYLPVVYGSNRITL